MYVHEKRLFHLYTFNNYILEIFYRYNMQEALRTILVYRFEKIDLLFEIKHAYFFLKRKTLTSRQHTLLQKYFL